MLEDKNSKSEVKEELVDEKPKYPIKNKPVFMFLLADFMHNFVDGVALGVAFAFSNFHLSHIYNIFRYQSWYKHINWSIFS